MRPERRRLLLAGVFAACAALVAWDRLGGASTGVVEAVRRPDPVAAAAPAIHGQPVTIARLAPRGDYLDALAAEAEAGAAATAAIAPPPPPPSAPAEPAPPPQPPFRVIGKGRVDGGWEVYLAQANRVLVAHPGDRLDGQYEVVAIAPPALRLLYLPTHEASTLAIGAAFDD